MSIGAVSLMPADHVHGMRADTLKLIRELNSPIYRWPGGNFVSGYEWRDAIGDPDKRPPRKNPASAIPWSPPPSAPGSNTWLYSTRPSVPVTKK